MPKENEENLLGPISALFDKLIGRRKPRGVATPDEGDAATVEEVPSSISVSRAESALPGTSQLAPLIELREPPVAPEFEAKYGGVGERDYAPDPIAEFSVEFTAETHFDCSSVRGAMDKSWRESVMRPRFYVETPEGRTKYLIPSSMPPIGTKLIAAWTFRDEANRSIPNLITAIEGVERWLAVRPEGFSRTSLVDRAAMSERVQTIESIIALRPDTVGVVVRPVDSSGWYDGRRVWEVLHAIGFRWGDMDCFHWEDATGQCDHLVSVSVEDEYYGFALPEEIASGAQNFRYLYFGFRPPRTPSPSHVFAEMMRAIDTVIELLGGRLEFTLDDQTVYGSDVLSEAILKLDEDLAALGTKPASTSVMMLR